jgi:ABC-type uncharacterized transport system
MWQVSLTMQHRHNTVSASAKNAWRPPPARGAAGQSQTILLAVVSFLAGLALSAVLLSRGHSVAPRPMASGQGIETSGGFSDATLAVLRRLQNPVTIRYYSLLDAAAVPTSLPAFADRVNEYLSAYAQAADGKIKLTRISADSYANDNAAAADGIKGFNLAKGNPCFLGIAVACGGQKGAVPSLAPEWESSLEADVTRAIARVADAAARAQPASTPTAPDSGALDSVKHALPNLDAMSLQDATRTLRESALTEFAQATREMDARMKDAQQRLEQAKASQSPAEQESAMSQLQQLQAQQTQRLKQIAANCEAQIQALQLYKGASK